MRGYPTVGTFHEQGSAALWVEILAGNVDRVSCQQDLMIVFCIEVLDHFLAHARDHAGVNAHIADTDVFVELEEKLLRLRRLTEVRQFAVPDRLGISEQNSVSFLEGIPQFRRTPKKLAYDLLGSVQRSVAIARIECAFLLHELDKLGEATIPPASEPCQREPLRGRHAQV